MAKKSRDKCIFGDKRNLRFMSGPTITFGNSKCAGFQTKDAFKLERCKQINLVSLTPDDNKMFSGSLVLKVHILLY